MTASSQRTAVSPTGPTNTRPEFNPTPLSRPHPRNCTCMEIPVWTARNASSSWVGIPHTATRTSPFSSIVNCRTLPPYLSTNRCNKLNPWCTMVKVPSSLKSIRSVSRGRRNTNITVATRYWPAIICTSPPCAAVASTSPGTKGRSAACSSSLVCDTLACSVGGGIFNPGSIGMPCRSIFPLARIASSTVRSVSSATSVTDVHPC
mmetsp:Transcript_33796/g.77217  ORF Transcript_33796/g.77217 Transcript_33796/m.77217 type:complete len:205 (-) Transcript_33796:499-1113(-)